MTEILHPAAIDYLSAPLDEKPEPVFTMNTQQIKRPDVSVLVPAFNCRHTLRRAVMSALEQDGVSVQVVIADDKSTDDTVKIAWELASQPKQGENTISIVGHLNNRRIAETLNTAAAIADGRYFFRCDSDDWLEQGCLSRFVRYLDAHPEIGFVYGARQHYGRRSDVYRPQPFNRAEFDLRNAAGYCYLFRREIWDAGLRWRALGTFGGAVIDLEDWQHLQAMLAQGIVGMAMPDVLALHYLLRWDGTWGELQTNQAAALAEFKRLWPNVKAAGL